MTGGVGTEYQVSLYNEEGFLNYLPMMNQGRYDHGCGHYINKELELVETQCNRNNMDARIHLYLFRYFWLLEGS